MIERIKQVKATYGITNQQIANESGLSIYTVTKQLQGLYKVDVDILVALIHLAPAIDARWLLTGQHNDIELRVSKLEKAVFG